MKKPSSNFKKGWKKPHQGYDGVISSLCLHEMGEKVAPGEGGWFKNLFLCGAVTLVPDKRSQGGHYRAQAALHLTHHIYIYIYIYIYQFLPTF